MTDQLSANPAVESLQGLRAGCSMATESLFAERARLVIDASHVNAVQHDGVTLVPLAEIFQEPAHPVLGFGIPNVYLTVPSTDGGWTKFAATMFFRQQGRVVDTRGRVQGGVLFELRDLPDVAVEQLNAAMAELAGRRSITCARANARVLDRAGFTSGGRRLRRCVRPTTMAARLWRNGLEYNGVPVEVRVIRTASARTSDHFRAVVGKELRSVGRLATKLVKQLRDRGNRPDRAPIVEPRPLDPAEVTTGSTAGAPSAELRVSSPSRIGSFLSGFWGEHPIFEARHDRSLADLGDDEFQSLHDKLPAYPGKLDRATKLKRYVLFSRPMVALIRRQFAASEQSLGLLTGPTLVGMLQVGTVEQPFRYSGILTSSGLKISRVENRTGRDRRRINWVLAKHVLLAGYDPDVRFAGEVWVTDGQEGRVLHVNNDSGTYKPSVAQTEATAAFLRKAYGVPTVAHGTTPGEV